MAFTVSFNLDEGALGDSLDRVRDQLDDLTELMTILSGRAIKLIQRKFQRGGYPQPWVPLSERTLKSRRGGGAGAKPLLDTGKMRSSLIARGTGGIYEISGDGFKVGTNLIYAATHQFGRGNIPARPFIPEEEELATELVPVVERYLADKLGS